MVKEKSAIQTEGESHNKETEKLDAKTQKVKQPKEEKPAKEEKKHEPAFPHETTINSYGFLQFGTDIMQEALGLTKSGKNPSGKAVYPETKVVITGFNAETREITIKVA